MEQLNPQFSRTRRVVFIARIVFLVTFVAAVVFLAARSNITSRASNEAVMATPASDNGLNTPFSKVNFSAPRTSTVTVNSCTVDPVVLNNSDSGAGSLRQAIVDACDGSTITFNMVTVTSPITLTSAELSINKNLTITGPGASVLTVQRSTAGGTPDFRIFNIGSGTVNISGVTVTNGKTPDGTAGGSSGSPGGDGGGILNASTLTLTDVTVTSNKTGVGGAGLNFGGFGGSGGGVASTGTLAMTNCTFTANSTGKGGPGNPSVGDGGNGGGLYNSGTLTMTNCFVNGNTAGDAGDTSGIAGRGGEGGGIYSRVGVLTLTNVTVSNNVTGNSLASTGNNAFAGSGGGIFIILGLATLTNCTVSGNQTGTTNGGVNGYGGGIDNECPMTIVGSTISGNTGNAAGAILNRRALTMTNCTVSGNHTFDNFGASIVSSDSGSSLTLTNGTITENSGFGIDAGQGTTTVGNSIIANNNSGGDANFPDVSGISNSQGHNLVGKTNGSFTGPGDQVGTPAIPLNPRLGPLANNGGATQTHALLPGSSALNAGSNTLATNVGLTTDQRGLPRIANTTVDIGAFESQGFTIAATGGTPQSAPIMTAFTSPSLATVSSESGEPVAGGVIIFTAPSSGASGTFPGNLMTVNAPINASGVATAPVFTANGIAGPYNVVASLSGGSPSANFALTNLKGDQTITFNALANKTFGDPDFTVSATSTSSLTVSFSAVGNCTVTGTLVHLTGAGSCTITANQAGEPNFNKAADVPQIFSIANAVTTTAVASSVNPSDLTQSVTFSATVTSGAGTPTGTVQFKDGGANIDLAQTLNAGGVAQLTISSLAAGTHTITADYHAAVNFLTSSGTLSGGQIVKSQPTLSINDVSIAEGNSGTTNFVFTVTLSAASNLTVNVDYATANGTATVADNDYQAVALSPLTFNPGEVTKAITVLVNGDQKFEPDETFFVNLTNAAKATISRSQGVGTILNDDTLQLILDESGPDPNQAAAFDSLLFVRDPFYVQSIANWFDLGSDRNTRVIIFAANLQLNPGETASAVVVSLVDGNNQPFDVPAEDVRLAPNTNFAQVTFRLPNSLAPGACTVTVKAHSQISNSAIIRIGP